MTEKKVNKVKIICAILMLVSLITSILVTVPASIDPNTIISESEEPIRKK